MFSKQDIAYYFSCFKNENIFLISAGLVAIVFALFFLFRKNAVWYKGLAVPLLVFGAMNCIAGYNNYRKAHALQVRNIYSYDMNPSGLQVQELNRVKEVYAQTSIFIYINLGLIAAAIIVLLFCRKKAGWEYYAGAATGVLIIVSTGIAASLFMQIKTRQYINGIATLVKQK